MSEAFGSHKFEVGRLDTAVDSIRGPGSAVSEKIPSASSAQYSPVPLGVGDHSHWHPDEDTLNLASDGAVESEIDTDVELEDNDLQIVVVGGDIGALVAALALANVKGIGVTLVNVGLGLGTFGSLMDKKTNRGLQLAARSVALLASLDSHDREDFSSTSSAVQSGFGVHENYRNQGSRASRWKGRPRAKSTSSIGERLREKGIVLNGYTLRKYDDGTILTQQPYLAIPSGISGLDGIPSLAIDSEDLHEILLDACLVHPHIDVRPRAVVSAVRSGTRGSGRNTSNTTSKPHSERSFLDCGNELVELDSQTFGFGKDSLASKDTFDTDKSIPRPRDSRQDNLGDFQRSRREKPKRRRHRESFINLGDEDVDLEVFSDLPPLSAQLAVEDYLQNLDPFTPEEMFTSTDTQRSVSSSSGLDMQPEEPGGPGVQPVLVPEQRPAVSLTSGEVLEADVILGSEGPPSKVLEAIQPVETESKRQEGYANASVSVGVACEGIYRAYIPMEKLRGEENLRKLVGKAGVPPETEISVWIGPGHHVTGFVVNEDMYYVSVTHRVSKVNQVDVQFPGSGGEDEGEILARRMKDEISGWCPEVSLLVGLAEVATHTPLYDHVPLEEWVSTSGKVAVLGDAAHPLVPYSHQEMSITVEDAVTLAALFAKFEPVSNLDDSEMARRLLIPDILRSYASLRRPRCLRTQVMLHTGRDLFHLTDGDDQRNRDMAFKEGGLLDDEEKKEEWRFDPLEEVEKWWLAEGKERLKY